MVRHRPGVACALASVPVEDGRAPDLTLLGLLSHLLMSLNALYGRALLLRWLIRFLALGWSLGARLRTVAGPLAIAIGLVLAGIGSQRGFQVQMLG
jgi:hypothetical protein